MAVRYLRLAVALLAAPALALRTVRWSVQSTKSVAASPTFAAWFEGGSAAVNEAIVAANDAISGTKDLGGGRFEARVKSASFPLVQLEPVMTFTCERDGGAVTVRLDDQRMEATGPSWATRIVVAVAEIMDTTSSSRFSVADGELTCDATVEASFNVPRWVPIPLKSIQEGGLKAVTKQVEGDVATMVVNLLKNDPKDEFEVGSGI